ncbi:hypothetical protein MTO96_016112 [Rhipicephalus appendiculatus]
MGNTDGSESRERSDPTTDDTVTLDLRADVLPPRKVFWDPVHGQISLHPVSVAVIDTPEFQRLRHIRQLGHVAYLYPGASNSRFEHSLGTAHLARLLGSHLRDCQPELKLSDKGIAVPRIGWPVPRPRTRPIFALLGTLLPARRS